MSYQAEDRIRSQIIEEENLMIDAFASGERQPDPEYFCESCGNRCSYAYCSEPCQKHGQMKYLANEMIQTLIEPRNVEYVHPKLRELADGWIKAFVAAGGTLPDAGRKDEA